MKICVYCASSARVDDIYFDATRRLGQEFLREKVDVVYGGGAIGLMGCLADTVLAGGGRIRGVIPTFMHEVEWTHPGLTEVEFTETMAQRKARFLEGVDGLVALPGGTGTLEELIEAISLKRLGLFAKPIVILNTGGFYDPLDEMLRRCVQERFMKEKHLGLWRFVREPEEILPILRDTPDWDKDALKSAVVQ